jgi:hypothetical protein
MANEHILQLADLPVLHPACGAALLHQFALPAVYRLNTDPSPQPPGTTTRRVEIDWIAHPGSAPATQAERTISWGTLALPNMGLTLTQLPVTMNTNDITTFAAIAVMALLIRDLENRPIQEVLQIGSGGDYLVQAQGESALIQLEASGIRAAQTMALPNARLREKTSQVLSHNNQGFVSVTTFSVPNPGGAAVAHSYLHYVMLTHATSVKKKTPKKGKK